MKLTVTGSNMVPALINLESRLDATLFAEEEKPKGNVGKYAGRGAIYGASALGGWNAGNLLGNTHTLAKQGYFRNTVKNSPRFGKLVIPAASKLDYAKRHGARLGKVVAGGAVIGAGIGAGIGAIKNRKARKEREKANLESIQPGMVNFAEEKPLSQNLSAKTSQPMNNRQLRRLVNLESKLDATLFAEEDDQPGMSTRKKIGIGAAGLTAAGGLAMLHPGARRATMAAGRRAGTAIAAGGRAAGGFAKAHGGRAIDATKSAYGTAKDSAKGFGKRFRRNKAQAVTGSGSRNPRYHANAAMRRGIPGTE